MNLYSHHDKPDTLHRHEDAKEAVPAVVWEKLHTLPKTEWHKYKMVMAKNAKDAVDYASALRKPFPEGEAAILKNAVACVAYARYALRKPWPKGESIIAANARCAFDYAQNVMRGPFPAGEKAISKLGLMSSTYAITLLKAPFPEGGSADVCGHRSHRASAFFI